MEDADEIAAAGLKGIKKVITSSARKPVPNELIKRLARTAREDAGV